MPEIAKWRLQQKTVSAEEAVRIVKSGDLIHYGEFALFPTLLDKALAKRLDELYDVEIRSTCYTQMPEGVKNDPDRKHFIIEDYHFGGISRQLLKDNLVNYIPTLYHQMPRIIRKYIDIDVAFLTAAPMDNRGFFNFGLSNSLTSAVISKARKIIIEVNENVPVCLGGNQEMIHVSRVDYIVHGEHGPLLQLKQEEGSDVDRAIAARVLAEIEDGSCLQLGIGALPNSVGALIAESGLKDLGIHTEMLTDACVDLYEEGRITGDKKQIDTHKMTYTFAMGTQKLYDFLHNNTMCASYPTNWTNNPQMIAANNKVVAINSALEIDLFSQVASESVGTRQISGTGGQVDFISGAFNSHGGKGLICLSSTFTASDGTIHSRIRPTLSPGTIVTLPRTIVFYVITEYGTVQLKGLSTWQRAEALINIAHPSFRDELIKEADKMKIWRRSNRLRS
jgi:butyryl-CoA:acetate CoA-transferase